jgi:hypothetical protein
MVISITLITVSTHSYESKPRRWSRVKGQLITKFHTVSHAAKLAKCHHNSFRLAAFGQCPRVRAWLIAQGIILEDNNT